MHSSVVRRTIPALLTALALTASAACSNGGADKGSAGANPTVATEPPTNPTVATAPALTTTTNPYTVPAVIDVAYVNRVLAGLDAAMGDVLRIVMRTRTIPPEAYDRMKSVFHDNDRLQRAIDSFQQDLRSGMPGYKPEPGNKVSVVTRIITARANCIFTEVRRDYTAVSVSPLASLTMQWIAIRPLDPTRDPKGYNTTRWAYIYEGFPADHSQPADPCAT